MKRNLALVAALVAIVLMISSSNARAQSAAGESWSSCASTFCIDAPPQGPGGADGSGGWGWSNTAKAPVSILTVGTPAGFTVTVLQRNDGQSGLCGSGDTLTITLTYSSYDFTLSSTDTRGSLGTDLYDRGGVMTFSYSGDFLCNTDQSVAYTFTPMNPDLNALVTATVSVGGQQASETFPVAILKPIKLHK